MPRSGDLCCERQTAVMCQTVFFATKTQSHKDAQRKTIFVKLRSFVSSWQPEFLTQRHKTAKITKKKIFVKLQDAVPSPHPESLP